MYPTVTFEGQTAKGLPIRLRPPILADLRALWEYINALSQERTFLFVQGEAIAYDDEADWLNRKLDELTAKEAIMILAFHDNHLVGNVGIDLEHGVKRHMATLGISVAQGYRGRGLGELLLTTAIEEANKTLPGLEIIKLEVFGNNPTAMNLYRKMGFVEFGRIPRGIIHRGEYVDDVMMYRPARLSAPG